MPSLYNLRNNAAIESDSDQSAWKKSFDLSKKQVALWNQGSAPIPVDQIVTTLGGGSELINDIAIECNKLLFELRNILSDLEKPIGTLYLQSGEAGNILPLNYFQKIFSQIINPKPVSIIVVKYNAYISILKSTKKNSLKEQMETNLSKLMPLFTTCEALMKNIINKFASIADELANSNLNPRATEREEEASEKTFVHICNNMVSFYSSYSLISQIRENIVIKKYTPVELTDANFYLNRKIQKEYGGTIPFFIQIGQSYESFINPKIDNIIRQREVDQGRQYGFLEKIALSRDLAGVGGTQLVLESDLINYLSSPQIRSQVNNEIINDAVNRSENGDGDGDGNVNVPRLHLEPKIQNLAEMNHFYAQQLREVEQDLQNPQFQDEEIQRSLRKEEEELKKKIRDVNTRLMQEPSRFSPDMQSLRSRTPSMQSVQSGTPSLQSTPRSMYSLQSARQERPTEQLQAMQEIRHQSHPAVDYSKAKRQISDVLASMYSAAENKPSERLLQFRKRFASTPPPY